jgi:dTDP-4-amino-4,6-dideoxygalactose transaminase
MSSSSFTPVLRPRLPEADRLLPYLRRIDQNRVYANFGPLALELAERLAARFSLRGENVVTAASGTAALIGAILGTVGRAGGEKPLALVPGFSFIATAVAAESCGFEVVFADVDEGSGLLDPAEALNNPLLDRIGLVIPVGAFGKGIPQSEWLDFRKKTGVGVVIDAAACFEAIDRAPDELLGEIPVALSFHATKSFASGEGGCAITSDAGAARDIVRALNFGFYGSRECRAASINGKMSEYHAAVGLAELDGWSEKSRALTAVADQYRTSFEEAGLDGRFLGAPETASCYALFRCKSAREGQGLSEYLEARGIGGRFWYGGGGHKEPYFAPRPALRVVDEIAAALLGLPVAPDLAPDKIKEIVSCIAAFERLA